MKIACIGDSLTYGYLVDDRATNCYPAVLNDLLGDNYVVGNFGVNGHTMLKTGDLPYWEHENFRLSGLSAPNVVIIMLGTNDSKPHNFTTIADFTATYEEMIRHYQRLTSKPLIYLATPPTVFPALTEGMTTIRGEVIKQLANATRELAKDLQIALVDINELTLNRRECFTEDGVHTNKAGAKLIADAFFTQLCKK